MICITYRSLNVGQERKAYTIKNVLVCIDLKRGRTHQLIYVKGLFKVVLIPCSKIVRLKEIVQMRRQVYLKDQMVQRQTICMVMS